MNVRALVFLFLFLLVIGIWIGFQLSLMAMRAECAQLGGTQTGSICTVTGAANE